MRLTLFKLFLLISLSLSCHLYAGTPPLDQIADIPSNQPKNTSQSLSFWKGIAPFGSEKTDPDEQIQQAFKEIKAYFYALDHWRTDIYLPLEAQVNWQDFRQAIEHTSSPEFFTLPESRYGDIHFSGRWANKDQTEFQFSMHDNTDDIETDQLGEVTGHLQLSSDTIDSEQIFTRLRAEIFMDSILFTEALASIEAVNQLFDQAPSEGITEASNQAFDHMLREEFKQSLPRLMETLERISTIEKLAQFENSPAGFPVTRITHLQRINLKALKQHFPDTYRDYKTLLRSASWTSEILTDQGQRIGLIQYDADSYRFRVEFVLAKGGFMLQDRKGRLLNHILFPTQLSALNYHISTNASLELFGLSVDVRQLNIEARYDAGLGQAKIKRNALIHMQLNTSPEIEVHGALLYFLPTWLIDLLIPGTLETLIADTYQDMVLGRNGQGITLHFDFKERQHQHWLTVDAAANIPYSLLQGLFKVSEKERSDRPRLYRTLRKNLRDDFAGFAGQVDEQAALDQNTKD